MGRLTVRKIDDELIRRLKFRAAGHGRSAEAEHREIVKQALLPQGRPEVECANALRSRVARGSLPADDVPPAWTTIRAAPVQIAPAADDRRSSRSCGRSASARSG